MRSHDREIVWSEKITFENINDLTRLYCAEHNMLKDCISEDIEYIENHHSRERHYPYIENFSGEKQFLKKGWYVVEFEDGEQVMVPEEP